MKTTVNNIASENVTSFVINEDMLNEKKAMKYISKPNMVAAINDICAAIKGLNSLFSPQEYTEANSKKELFDAYHRFYIIYTDLRDAAIEARHREEEKAERVKILLDTMQYLYRDIKGRRENLSPLFVIGGRYSRKNPFFENRVKVDDNKINVETLQELIKDNELAGYTFTGITSGIFDNEKIVREELKAESVGTVFKHLKEEVNLYYGESN